jgi:hypothetical protein
VEVRRKDQGERSDADLGHMRKVIGYVHPHLAQRPTGDVGNTRWRWPLMNWRHETHSRPENCLPGATPG